MYDDVITLIIEQYNGVLFGSYAFGVQRENSDIDIAVHYDVMFDIIKDCIDMFDTVEIKKGGHYGYDNLLENDFTVRFFIERRKVVELVVWCDDRAIEAVRKTVMSMNEVNVGDALVDKNIRVKLFEEQFKSMFRK